MSGAEQENLLNAAEGVQRKLQALLIANQRLSKENEDLKQAVSQLQEQMINVEGMFKLVVEKIDELETKLEER